MASSQNQPAGGPTFVRPPPWVMALRIVGAISFVVGVVYLLRLRNPGPHSHSLVIGVSLVFAGVVLFPVAWMKRVRRPSHDPAEERAQEADNQPIPPREA